MFGRAIYEGFVSFWDGLDPTDPSVTKEDVEFAEVFRGMKRIVVSRTLDRVERDAILIRVGHPLCHRHRVRLRRVLVHCCILRTSD
ncbi:MAG: hypothetical protein ACRDH0_12150 [Actinomycetota bacterium]